MTRLTRYANVIQLFYKLEKRNSIFNTGSITFKVPGDPVLISGIVFSLWLKASPGTGSKFEVMEVDGFAKIWTNNDANQYNTEISSVSISMNLPSGETMTSWHKLLLTKNARDFGIYAGIDKAQPTEYSLPLCDFIISDVYFFGYKIPSAFPKFQGYIRDVALSLRENANYNPSLFYNENLYRRLPAIDAYFVLRMDEQYTNVIENYNKYMAISLPPTVTFQQASETPPMCLLGFVYNPATSKCESKIII